ncbi:MAG: Methyltransferase type 11 [Myxococcales bacterium]|nr:Methyltransferase type 11 [Myxococcales bacterium]
MSKRDEDSDMELGMTTAERRRRRRRGGGLRVPSDNVPRRAPTSPPVAPVPEDPSLAMSIAYSFTNDASGPHPRTTLEQPAIIAPDAAPTVIDPPSGQGFEQQDFEMKTREMSAVDLQSLGLDEPNAASSTTRMERVSQPKIDVLPPIKAAPQPLGVRFKDTSQDRLATDRLDEDDDDVDVDVTLDSDIKEPAEPKPAPEKPKAVIPPIRPSSPSSPPVNRLRTVALSDDDLEDVRAPTQPIAPPVMPVSPANPPRSSATSIPPPPPMQTAAPRPARNSEVNRTQPLTPVDIEILPSKAAPAAAKGTAEEPMSVPEIDIQELADRAEQSGEIEVDVDEAADGKTTDLKTATPPLPRASTVPPVGDKPADRKSGAFSPDPHAAPPPPPKAPPAPPPKKGPPPAAVASVVAKADPGKPAPRGKPWFSDLFDEDYLRTLPFLTAQATQAEAEFVIEAMTLQPGANVLDVGCGYGRHAMELAARGYHVVGLDLSTPLLVRGGEEAQRRGLTINFVRGDMRELDFENQFDAAYCLFSTFGYFDDETNKKALTNIARALKTGGKVLIEILNRDYIIADLPTRVWWEGEGCVVLEEVELNYFSSRIQVNRSVVFDDGRQLEQEISVRAYSLHEVGKLMHAAGFRVLEVSGGYQTRGRFFGNQSRHIIVLAERKETSGTPT